MGERKYFSKEERLAARREQYQLNREKRIAQTRASQIKRHIANPELGKELRRRDLERNPRRDKQANLADYGLSLDRFDAMNESQKSLCAICDGPQIDYLNGKLKTLAVDHDPKLTKKLGVRMLLCSKCNRALGLFQDDAEVLENAVAYLQYWNGVYHG